jgi:hypothetical protein
LRLDGRSEEKNIVEGVPLFDLYGIQRVGKINSPDNHVFYKNFGERWGVDDLDF